MSGQQNSGIFPNYPNFWNIFNQLWPALANSPIHKPRHFNFHGKKAITSNTFKMEKFGDILENSGYLLRSKGLKKKYLAICSKIKRPGGGKVATNFSVSSRQGFKL